MTCFYRCFYRCTEHLTHWGQLVCRYSVDGACMFFSPLMRSPNISKILLNSGALTIQSQGAVYNIKSMWSGRCMLPHFQMCWPTPRIFKIHFFPKLLYWSNNQWHSDALYEGFDHWHSVIKGSPTILFSSAFYYKDIWLVLVSLIIIFGCMWSLHKDFT